MREIKFRAWNVGHMDYMTDLYWFEETGAREVVNGIGCGHYADYHIMQFTGLRDANGVEIYEGDIINVYNWGLRKELLGVAIVEWCTDDKGWRHNPALGADDAYDQFRRVEIIGNIHQNPELLSED